MNNRQQKRQLADERILQPLLEIVLRKGYKPNEDGIVNILIQLDNRFTLLVGITDNFRVPNITQEELVDMLNLLSNHFSTSLIKYDRVLSGKAFLVYLKVPLKAESNVCKIIPINTYQKVA
jgi:hypothetical protein